MTEVDSNKSYSFGRVSMNSGVVLKGLHEVTLEDPETFQETLPPDEEEAFSFDNQASNPTLELKLGGRYFRCW